MGIPLDWLQGSPFDDYLIPGVVLLTLLGIVPLLVARGLWTGRRWAWAAALLVGSTLIIWLGVEIAVIGYQAEPPLQVIYGIVALTILGSALAPPVREHVRTPADVPSSTTRGPL